MLKRAPLACKMKACCPTKAPPCLPRDSRATGALPPDMSPLALALGVVNRAPHTAARYPPPEARASSLSLISVLRPRMHCQPLPRMVAVVANSLQRGSLWPCCVPPQAAYTCAFTPRRGMPHGDDCCDTASCAASASGPRTANTRAWDESMNTLLACLMPALTSDRLGSWA